MTKDEAKRILDQYKDGRLFLPRTIRLALSVSEKSEALAPYGYDEGVETIYMGESARVGE
jgi:hypothetical protein